MDPGPASARKGAEALRYLEDVVVEAGGGWFRDDSDCFDRNERVRERFGLVRPQQAC